MRIIDLDLNIPADLKFSSSAASRYDLSLVVPTINEAKNIPLLLEKLDIVLSGLRWEIVFVDDNSKDDSPALFIRLSQERDNVRFIRRIGRSGLSTAVTEGMLTCSSPHIGVMDADLQHDERILPQMLQVLQADEADIVVGSRFLEGADNDGLTNFRTKLSLFSNVLAQKLFGVPLKDSMGNFFMLKREVIEHAAPNLCGRGQKLLFDILISGPKDVRVGELPIYFGKRLHGESKLSIFAAIEFGLQMYDRLLGRYLPARILLDMCLILLFALSTTMLTWLGGKLGLPHTMALPIAAIPSVAFIFQGAMGFTPKRKRPSGFKRWIEFGQFLLATTPFIALSVWILMGNLRYVEHSLRAIFGASLVCSVGVMLASSWRKEVMSKR
jgi:dolichol-phosphate mannosyltransferase